MRWSVVVASLLAFTASFLSGCTGAAGCGNSAQGQTCEGPGALAYNGASEGSQTSKAIECGGEARFAWSANVGSGSVTFTVLDGAGIAQFSKTVDGPGQAADEDAVDGLGGDWRVRATRSGSLLGGFSGQYAADLHC